jgi:hypothetical protein
MLHVDLKLTPLALIAGAFLPACAVTGSSVDDVDAAAKSSAAQFEYLKSLTGTWVATVDEGGVQRPIETRWRLTGAGSAIEETLFADSPHEMVSMIHRDGPYLMMTHYCSAGNQPRMRAVFTKPPVGAAIEFEYIDATNLKSAADMHMASARYELMSDGKLHETWTAVENGKPGHTADFTFTRKH